MRRRRVLALELTSKVFSFVVLEGPERLIVWGSRGITADVSRYLPKLAREVERYRPDVLVLEDAGDSRKGQRVKAHLAWSEQWASDEGLAWRAIPRSVLEEWAAHLGADKQARAAMLARLFPELSELVPPPRKPWQAQFDRLNLFVALSRGLCYYDQIEHEA